jgi:hypothetical protein
MTAFRDISHSLRQIYLEDERPWLVGFSGGKRMEKHIEFRELLCGALECGSLLPLSPRELARGHLVSEGTPASKLACNKAAASCRTPKLRYT